jgi:aerobic carbon-monoxide dehydrogenase small subunit
MSFEIPIELTLNGRAVRLSVPLGMSALTMLRARLGQTGAKLACGEGECGACTIMVDGRTINSCLMMAADCDGRTLTTIEGLRSADGLDPVQKAFVEHGAIQCGYCMPGMIMQAKYLVTSGAATTEDEIRRGLEGNVCRCTGYRKVVDAVVAAARAG